LSYYCHDDDDDDDDDEDEDDDDDGGAELDSNFSRRGINLSNEFIFCFPVSLLCFRRFSPRIFLIISSSFVLSVAASSSRLSLDPFASSLHP